MRWIKDVTWMPHIKDRPQKTSEMIKPAIWVCVPAVQAYARKDATIRGMAGIVL